MTRSGCENGIKWIDSMAIFEQIDDKICNIEILDFQTPQKIEWLEFIGVESRNYIVMTSRNA